MNTKLKLRWSIPFLMSAFGNLVLTAFGQGSLTPAGAPAPTMKTLSQIEPRTPISSLPFAITSSGAYYLASNLTGSSGTNGISISAPNVDLDLMGFTLAGTSGSGDGVVVISRVNGIQVHNGSVQGWGGYGVNISNATSSHVEKLSAVFNGVTGVAVGTASTVNDCQATSNLWIGISAGSGSVVRDCAAGGNGNFGTGPGPTPQFGGIVCSNAVVVTGCASTGNLGYGLLMGNDSTIGSCSAIGNNVGGRGATGISTGNGCTIVHCSANENLYTFVGNGIVTGSSCIIKECIANANNVGIATGIGCNIMDCIASGNAVSAGYGIVAGDTSIVRGCLATQNEYGGIGYGNGCFVHGNLAAGQIDAGYTYFFDTHFPPVGTNSTLVNNAMGTSNHFYLANNSISNAIGTVESASTLNTNKNPHANFSP